MQHEGGYTDYVNRKKATEVSVAGKTSGQNDAADVSDAKNSWKAGQKRKLKFTYQEQKDYETIESDIAALEEKIQQLEEGILKNAHDFVKLNQITKEKEEAEKRLEEMMDRWMYLEDKAARIERGEFAE